MMGNRLQFISETSDGLVRFVGYNKVIEALDLSRSTIERAVNAGELPPPRSVRGKRVWLAAEINAWATELFEGRLNALENSAVTNPDELEPEELGAKAHELAVMAVSKITGEPVDRADVKIRYQPKFSAKVEQELQQGHRLHMLEALEPIFADFCKDRAWFIVAWLFPSLRQGFSFGDDERGRLLQQPDNLRRFAMKAMDDEEWADAQAVVRRRRAERVAD